jgi:putative heme iron utilization protein
MNLDPDVAAQIQKVLKHLNGKHADTVLFLARHAAGVADAVEAELLRVDSDGVDIAVRQPLRSSTARLQFAEAIHAAPEFRLQLRGLLDKARAAAPDEPPTSLEQVIESPRGNAPRSHESDSRIQTQSGP